VPYKIKIEFEERRNMEKVGSRKALPYVIAVIIVVVLAALFFAGAPPPIPTLYPGEVRNYQGEDLSSIAGVLINEINGIQVINESTYRLNIVGLVDRPQQLTYSEVVGGHQKYQKVVTIFCVEGWYATILWEGVLVKDLLEEAGANMSAPVVIFRASDGYSTSLPLDYIVNNNILLADKMNSLTMPTERGFPFELVAETQYGYKWIKWVTQIEVSNDVGYLGYWETRGYPNNATLR
jgi:DMSO/TMAO reductase YedYZ molybdopterin-dependent catalytic subunit